MSVIQQSLALSSVLCLKYQSGILICMTLLKVMAPTSLTIHQNTCSRASLTFTILCYVLSPLKDEKLETPEMLFLRF